MSRLYRVRNKIVYKYSLVGWTWKVWSYCWSCQLFFFDVVVVVVVVVFTYKNYAQNDQLTRHTKCGKKRKWKIGLRYPEAWGRSQYWHAHCSYPNPSSPRWFTFTVRLFSVDVFFSHNSFLIYSLLFKKINTSLQNNMAVSHRGEKKKEKDLCFLLLTYQ